MHGALTVPATVVSNSADDFKRTDTPKSPILATPKSGPEDGVATTAGLAAGKVDETEKEVCVEQTNAKN